MQLTPREATVLGEIVRLYVRDGEPISSRQLARASRLDLSAATMRNVMADLEEKGLLMRPHSSAGGIPTERSYRLYVDAIEGAAALTPATRRRLASRIQRLRRDPWEGMDWAAALLAEVTQEAGIAVRPLGGDPIVEAVSLLPLSGDRVLAVVVTADGGVDRRVLEELSWEREELQEVGNFLTATFRGVPYSQVRRRLSRVAEADGQPVALRAATLAERVFQDRDLPAEVLLVGAERLLETPDFAEADRIRSLLELLNSKERIVDVLRTSRGGEERTVVVIGRESDLTASGELGLVFSLFSKGGTDVGAVGVLGPQRMDYPRVRGVVEFLGDALTDMMDGRGEHDA